MAECFAGGHLRFVNGEWRDDNGDAIEISRVRHGRWIHTDLAAHWYGKDECSECTYHEHDRRDLSHFNYCPTAAQKWTEVTAITLWHEQEQMVDIGGMVTIFVDMGESRGKYIEN